MKPEDKHQIVTWKEKKNLIKRLRILVIKTKVATPIAVSWAWSVHNLPYFLPSGSLATNDTFCYQDG